MQSLLDQLVVLTFGVALALAPLVSPALAAGQISTLYSFGGTADGGAPLPPVTFDKAGNLYGEAVGGGEFCSAGVGSEFGGCGTVYKLSPGGQLTTLVTFAGPNGAVPDSQLTLVGDRIYGSTLIGGSNGLGVLFSVNTDGSAFTLLHQFAGREGATPSGRLISIPGGGFYGVTQAGGPENDGVLFKLLLNGSYLPLHAFGGTDGKQPTGILVGPSGTIYGSTEGGGGVCSSKFGCGTVYSFAPDSRQFSTLYRFQGKGDGKSPYLGSVSSGGVLYGATSYGGTALNGTLFAMTPSTGGAYAFSTIHTFIGNEGIEPGSGPTLLPSGDLVGTTTFTLYRYDASAEHPFTVLNTFDDGGYFGQPVIGPNNVLYGTSGVGGITPCVGTGGVVSSEGCGFLYTYGY